MPITIDGDGTITGANINRPAFRATVTTEQSVTTLTGITTSHSKEYEEVIEYNNEEFDTNSCYDPTTYRFTPNSAGYYHVFSQVYLTVSNDGSEIVRMILRIYKNTNTVISTYEHDMPDDTEYRCQSIATNGIVSMNGTTDYLSAKILVRLESNKTAVVDPVINTTLADSDTNLFNVFQAYKLNI